jgi:predicted TIM-barrel fold metal-dependent hydrolase
MNRRRFLNAAAVGSAALPLGCAAAPRSNAPPVIDAHAHAGRGVNFGSADRGAAPWTTFNDPERILRLAREAGIDRTIVFPISNDTYEKANEEIAGYARRWPDRLIGFAKHDGKTEAGRIGPMLRREVRELGLRGLKLHGTPTPEMVEAAAELGIPILFHPARVADGLAAVESAPQVPFILAHLGSFASREWQEHVRAIEAARRYPNLYLETSSVVFFDYLERAARELTAEKLIFGSDGPLVDPRVEIHKIRLLKLGPEAEAQVLGGNILRLLG